MYDNGSAGGDYGLSGVGGEHQGLNPSPAGKAGSPYSSQGFSHPGAPGETLPDEGEKREDDVYFRLQIIQALGREAEASVRVELVKLLDQEGQRRFRVAQIELENGLEEVRADGTTIRTGNWSNLIGTLLTSFQKFGNWVAMTAFAGFLASSLVRFLWNKDYTGAGHLKDILMVMLGGALGWVSKDRPVREGLARKEGKGPTMQN